MIEYPSFKSAEKTIKAALPCDGCDCQHVSARVNVYLDGDTLRVTHFRLGCGREPMVDLGKEKKAKKEAVAVEVKVDA